MTLKKASVLVEMTGALLDAGDKLIQMANHADKLMDITPKAVRATRKALKARKDLSNVDETNPADIESALNEYDRAPIDAEFEDIEDEDLDEENPETEEEDF